MFTKSPTFIHDPCQSSDCRILGEVMTMTTGSKKMAKTENFGDNKKGHRWWQQGHDDKKRGK